MSIFSLLWGFDLGGPNNFSLGPNRRLVFALFATSSYIHIHDHLGWPNVPTCCDFFFQVGLHTHLVLFFGGGAAGIVIAGSLGRCSDRIDLLGDVPIPIDCGWTKSTVNLSRGQVGISNAPTMTPGLRQKQYCPIFKMDKSSSPFGQQCHDDDINLGDVPLWRSLTPMGFPPSKNPWQRQATPRLSDHRSDTFAPPPSGTFAPSSSDTFAPSSSYRPLWL